MYRLVLTALTGIFAALLLANAFITAAVGQGGDEAASTTQYLSASFDDPVSRLQKRLDSGEAHMEWYDRHGYLRAVLRELHISPTSQTLVFSKTSLQVGFISPRTPRAVYFNDTSYVTWEQNAPLLEIATTDPRWGSTFYTLKQEKTSHPRFIRQSFDCLQCHQSPMTSNVPGLAVRSVFTTVDGSLELSAGTFLTTDRSPMNERWGGWYVTGTHGRQRHMGNVFARGSSEDGITLNRDAGANITDLKNRFDVAAYLGEHSDLVALMVLEHQSSVHNLITKANYLTRDALRDEEVMNKLDGKPANERRPATTRRIRGAAEPLLEALLFSGEVPLSDPVSGTSNFAREFALRDGPRDKQGRSLRELDLKERLLRYPCSYLIYSESFNALPAPAREVVFQRIGEIVDNKDTDKDANKAFAALSPADRRAIDEILRDTKPDYAAWRAAHP